MKPEISLLLVPGARSSQNIKNKLIEASLDELAVETVEDHLRALQPGGQFEAREIAYHCSVDYVASVWRTAAENAVDSLLKQDKPFKALMMFPVWYGSRRHERYSPIDIPGLGKLVAERGYQITRVISFIDDIYDMAARYTQPGEYFDLKDASREFLAPVRALSHADRDSAEDSLRLQNAAVGFWTYCLHTMLEWRRQDLIIGRNIACTFCPGGFLPFAIKQRADTARQFLCTEAPTIYLSHPISQPRRQHGNSGPWPEIVRIVNTLPERFLEYQACLLMPTGIDELRFRLSKEGWLPELTARWPFVDQVLYTDLYNGKDETITCKPDDAFSPIAIVPDALDGGDTYSFRFIEVRKSLAAQMISLVKAIEEQIGERDNALVLNTDAIFIYRPFFDDKGRPQFSAGVKAELDFWRLLKEEEALETLPSCRRRVRRCVIVHSPEDLDLWLGSIASDSGQLVNDLLVDRIVQACQADICATLNLSKAERKALTTRASTVVSKHALSPARKVKCIEYMSARLHRIAESALMDFLSGRVEAVEYESHDFEDELSKDIWVVVDSGPTPPNDLLTPGRFSRDSWPVAWPTSWNAVL